MRFHVDSWTCQVCGGDNRGGELCSHCGFRRPDRERDSKPKAKALPDTDAPVGKQVQRLASGVNGCLLLFMIPLRMNVSLH